MTGRKHRNAKAGPGALPGLAGPKAEKAISLALQGGGAHGAFTWGVLDAILEDGRLAIEAITGTSAGAMNAVVLVEGWLEGGADGARSQLRQFWKRVSLDGNMLAPQRDLFDRLIGYWSGQFWTDLWSQVASPYYTNPLDVHPLREALDAIIYFERVRSNEAVKVFVSATNVWTGKIAVFEGPSLTADHILASACLPTLFRAVKIDGVPHWDGGYLGNPALFPLFYNCAADDILLVQINPLERRETPESVQEIHNRLDEITFNANLLNQLRAIDFVKTLLQKGKLSYENYKDVRMHRIDGTGVLDKYPASTRMKAEWAFFLSLHQTGRATARRWLEKHFDAIGHESTLDLRGTYA